MTTKKTQQYFEAVGRRKTSIARVRVIDDQSNAGIVVNDKPATEYFHTKELLNTVTAPVRATGTEKRVSVSVKAIGGGQRGQADAVQLGIARALLKMDGEFNQTLRDLDYLKRDPRKKERKKPGLKKARRSPQWAKR